MKYLNYIDLNESDKTLVDSAVNIRTKAYAPYSNFKVGAATLGDDSNIYLGCNIESADYTLTTHAEMDAINSMVKSGCLSFKAIVVALESKDGNPVPCGLCRQKMVEFSQNGNVRIIGINLNSPDILFEWSLTELMPFQFNKETL